MKETVKISKHEAAIELLKRREARKSLAAYIGYLDSEYKTSYFSNTVCAAIDKFIEDVHEGKRPIIIFQAPPQHGKQIADETPVLTLQGWKTHGDLIVGDEVFSVDGTPTKIIAVSDKTPSNAKITMTNGEVIYCHERHEWTVHSRDKKRFLTLETCEMLTLGKKTLRSNPLSQENGQRFNYHLPLTAPLIGIAC